MDRKGMGSHEISPAEGKISASSWAVAGPRKLLSTNRITESLDSTCSQVGGIFCGSDEGVLRVMVISRKRPERTDISSEKSIRPCSR